MEGSHTKRKRKIIKIIFYAWKCFNIMRFRTLYLQTCAVLRVEYFYSFRVDDTITAFPHECLAGKGSEMGTADWIRGYAWVGLIWRLQEAHSPKPQGYIKSDAIMDFYYYIKSIDRILPHPSLIKKESRKDNKNKLKQELSTESRPMKMKSRIWDLCSQIRNHKTLFQVNKIWTVFLSLASWGHLKAVPDLRNLF